MMLSGTIDGNIHRIGELTEQQPSLIRVDTPINALVVRAYRLDPTLQIQHWQQLNGLRVAYLRGVLLIEDNLPEKVIRLESNTEIDALRALSAKVANLALFAEPKQSPPHPYAQIHQLQRLDIILEKAPLYHYLIDRHRELATKLNKVLEAMQADGRMEDIQRHALKNIPLPIESALEKPGF